MKTTSIIGEMKMSRKNKPISTDVGRSDPSNYWRGRNKIASATAITARAANHGQKGILLAAHYAVGLHPLWDPHRDRREREICIGCETKNS
jgi:hypothetical protein